MHRRFKIRKLGPSGKKLLRVQTETSWLSSVPTLTIHSQTPLSTNHSIFWTSSTMIPTMSSHPSISCTSSKSSNYLNNAMSSSSIVRRLAHVIKLLINNSSSIIHSSRQAKNKTIKVNVALWRETPGVDSNSRHSVVIYQILLHTINSQSIIVMVITAWCMLRSPQARHLGKVIAKKIWIAVVATAAKAERKILPANRPIAVVRDWTVILILISHCRLKVPASNTSPSEYIRFLGS